MSKRFFNSLKHSFVEQDNNLKTSIYYNEKSEKPIAILIHGFQGNAFGMSFLAEKMARHWQIILLELPSHGQSDVQAIETSQEFQNWNSEIISKIEDKFGKISLLVCHSMGCFSPSKEISKKIRTILINPIFEVSPLYSFFANMTYKVPLSVVISNLSVMMFIKALFLIRVWRTDSIKNVFNNTLLSINSPMKNFQQAKISKIPLEKSLLSYNSRAIEMLIIGNKDNLSKPLSEKDKEVFFPAAEIYQVPTGHLAPIEVPDILAKKFEDFLPNK